MSGKKPNPDAIMSELRKGSVFFRESAARDDEPVAERTRRTSTSTPAAVAEGVRDVHPVRPVRRKTMRHPFDFYEDQIDSLRRLSAQDRMQGGMGSMSEMVREALDKYIAGKTEGES